MALDHDKLTQAVTVEPRLTFNLKILYYSIILYCAAAVGGPSFGYLVVGSLARYAAVPLVLACLLTYRRVPGLKVNWATVGLYGVTLCALLSYFWSIQPSATLTRASTFLQLFIATGALGIGLRTLRRKGVHAIAIGMMIGSIVAALLVFKASHDHTFVGAAAYGDLIQRVSAGASDPNDIALSMAVTLPIFIFDRRLWVKAGIIPVVVAILLTGSRGALISAIVGLGSLLLIPMFSWMSARRGKRRGLRAWQAILFIIVAYVVGSKILPAGVSARFAQIPAQLTGGTLTNRTILWSAAWHGFLLHPLRGIGAGTAPYYMNTYAGYNLPTHNTHLSFLLELGLPGWSCFMVAVVAALIGAVWLNWQIPWLLSSLLALFIGSYALSWEYNKVLWLLLIVGGYALSEARLVRQRTPAKPVITGPTFHRAVAPSVQSE